MREAGSSRAGRPGTTLPGAQKRADVGVSFKGKEKKRNANSEGPKTNHAHARTIQAARGCRHFARGGGQGTFVASRAYRPRRAGGVWAKISKARQADTVLAMGTGKRLPGYPPATQPRRQEAGCRSRLNNKPIRHTHDSNNILILRAMNSTLIHGPLSSQDASSKLLRY